MANNNLLQRLSAVDFSPFSRQKCHILDNQILVVMEYATHLSINGYLHDSNVFDNHEEFVRVGAFLRVYWSECRDHPIHRFSDFYYIIDRVLTSIGRPLDTDEKKMRLVGKIEALALDFRMDMGWWGVHKGNIAANFLKGLVRATAGG